MLRRFLRDYLSLTSRERNGFMILVFLVLAMLLLRILLPGFRTRIAAFDRSISPTSDDSVETCACTELFENRAHNRKAVIEMARAFISLFP